MSFRRAFLVLLLVAAVLTVPFYYIVYIFSLNQPIHILLVIAAYIVVLGFLIRTLPGLKDSTEFIQNMFPGKQDVGRRREVSEASRNDPHNRENVLNAVQNSWIEGFLHQSIDREIRLLLGIKKDAVPRFDRLRRRLGQADEPVPVEQSIKDVYVTSGRKLLILGAPGSGKTITLLQLGEQLIAEARQDADKPLPLIFNLSSWGQHQGALADWLVEEMLAQYQIGRDLGRGWLEHGQTALLLDGLDEVVAEQRNACVTAINTFVDEYGTIDLVVCSRVEDYEKLQKRLNLSNAVLIQALSDAQIRGYLNTQTLQHVYTEIAADEQLLDLARAPLLLNMIAVAYAEDVEQPEITSAGTEEERIYAIFGRYVARMFDHRPLGDQRSYNQEDASRWLVQMAVGMQQQRVSKFFIERLQSNLLQTTTLQRLFKILSVLIGGLFGGLVGGLAGSLIGGLWAGLLFGLIGGLFGGLLNTNNELSSLPEKRSWHFPIKKDVRKWLFFLMFGSSWGMLFGFGGGLIGGILGAFFGGLIILIRPTESSVRGSPNQSIRNAKHNSLMVMLISILMVFFCIQFGQFLGSPLSEIDPELYNASVIALIPYIGLIPIYFFLTYGGGAIIQHYILRILLARENVLPYPFCDKKLVAFLDAMRDRLLLRRVGGGWVFIHRYLLEYFASLHAPPDDYSGLR